MFGCWSPVNVEEENPLHSDVFDPLKEWLVDPRDFCNASMDPDGLHDSEVKIEQNDQIMESSMDIKMMKKTSQVEISDSGNGEEGLEENGARNDGNLDSMKPGPVDLINDLQNNERSFEGKSDDEGSSSVEIESDGEDSSSFESSSEESASAAESLSGGEDDDGGVLGREEFEEYEEGEVREFDAHEIDALSIEEGGDPNRPIISKHEMEDLPPVPLVEVSLQPHHQLLPVGIISSIMRNRVIVEGSARHNPLDEGSILWFTDTRLPLGLVDELFGPVKNPYYVVRYNTEDEVPAGIGAGINISYAAEFASQILNDKDLYKKGYDASGENDEEVDIEVEFSDDEREAEYRKSLREGKRVIDDVKQEVRFDRKRTTFKGPRVHHKNFARPPMNQPRPANPVKPLSAPFSGQSGISSGPWSSSPRVQHKRCAQLSMNQHRSAPLSGQSGISAGSLNSSSAATNSDSMPRPAMPSPAMLPPTMPSPGMLPHSMMPPSMPPPGMPSPAMPSPGMAPPGMPPPAMPPPGMAPPAMPPPGMAPPAMPPPGMPPPAMPHAALPPQPLAMPQFSQAMQAVNLLSNQTQHGPIGVLHQLQNTGLQGDLPMQFMNPNLVLNNLIGMIALQQMLQQFVSYQGSASPWVGSAPSVQPLVQNNSANSPFGNGFLNMPDMAAMANAQTQGQGPLPFTPSMQFNAGSSSSVHSNGGNNGLRGRRPHQRGCGRFNGRGGRQPNR